METTGVEIKDGMIIITITIIIKDNNLKKITIPVTIIIIPRL